MWTQDGPNNSAIGREHEPEVQMSGSKKRTFTPHPSHNFQCSCGTDDCRDVSHQGRGYQCCKCQRSESDRQTQKPCGVTIPITAFDITQNPPTPSKHPKQVVILMRHGDRTPVRERFGDLDVSNMASAWTSLLPSKLEQAEMDSVRVEREEGEGYNNYSSFVGEGHLGQLTSLGYRQCRGAGHELRRRYPGAQIRAFSTDFQRTIQSASCVLLGFAPTETPVVHVPAPKNQTMLPNYDGSCKRYGQLRASLLEEAYGGALRHLRQEVQEMLTPLMGKQPMKEVLDFTPFCVHQDVVGAVPGIDWDLVQSVEKYKASLEGAVYANCELLRLAAGRLVQEVMDYLSNPGHQITLLAAHDNMMTAFLVALKIYKEQWPLYASMVLLETAEMGEETHVRVLMNDEVCLEWQPLEELHARVSGAVLSSAAYAAVCSS